MGSLQDRLIRATTKALSGTLDPRAANSRLGPEFDAFLFQTIGEDSSGLPLSIVSLLARMDLDPWEEAARLADLPPEAATQRLTLLLAASPVTSPTQAASESSVTHLIALLPRRTHFGGRSLEVVGASTLPPPRLVMHALAFAIWLLWLFGLETFIGRHVAPVHADIAHTIAPLATPLQAAPARSDP
jgi:hypothetical protein